MQTQTATLLDLIKGRIVAHGPISIADYMQLALTHPEFGYYTRKDPLGAGGDFITAPEISQLFGELIGLWLAEQWLLMGKPQAALTELGPGRGTLMADILRATKTVAGFHEAISLHLVETSPALRKKQSQALAKNHPHIEWHSSIAELPPKPLLLVANEFFDALPIQQFVYAQGEWRERRLDMIDGRLQFVVPEESGVSNPMLRERLYKIPDPGNLVVEYCEAAVTVASVIAAHIAARGGVALIVDYGGEGGHGDTLQAVRQHGYHDPLADPGTADITAHVDFGAIKRTAALQGAATHGPVPQGVFLSILGAQARAAKLYQAARQNQKAAILSGLDRLTSLDQMGDLFKVLAITPQDRPKPEGF
jgi:NADH dehydrogenase [ubiquinone] 1 alpha subcomplex assembly factor 7